MAGIVSERGRSRRDTRGQEGACWRSSARFIVLESMTIFGRQWLSQLASQLTPWPQLLYPSTKAAQDATRYQCDFEDYWQIRIDEKWRLPLDEIRGKSKCCLHRRRLPNKIDSNAESTDNGVCDSFSLIVIIYGTGSIHFGVWGVCSLYITMWYGFVTVHCCY